jgi:pimeloyl-ACP methyl ester carboxylesterase
MTFAQTALRFYRITRVQESSLSSSRAHNRTLSTTTQRETHDNQTFTLPDGRVLGYAEFGHPAGWPLLFFHGFPASRLEGWGAHEIARRCRIRVIALDRPGFGLSTFQPGRQITDWPDDVLSFVKHAKLKRFAVLGGSGGGPYALACAHRLPRDMMSAVGVMAGAPPWEAGRDQMSLSRRAISWTSRNTPAALGLTADGLIGLTRWIVTTGLVTRQIDSWLESQQQKEEAEKKDKKETSPVGADEQSTIAQQRDRLLRIVFDGFAQGSQAFVQEARLLSSQSWGFEFEDVSYGPIPIWHGTKDLNAPFPMIKYMAERLPHSVLHEFKGDTHYTIAKHLEQILRELAPPEGSTETALTD